MNLNARNPIKIKANNERLLWATSIEHWRILYSYENQLFLDINYADNTKMSKHRFKVIWMKRTENDYYYYLFINLTVRMRLNPRKLMQVYIVYAIMVPM